VRAQAHRWLRAAHAELFTLAVVAAAYVVGYVATVRYTPLFTPDSRYYAGMALWFSGSSKESAADQVAAYSPQFHTVGVPVDVLFGWGLTQPRVVYPVLSIPFVKLFGIEGLTVVPAIAMALFMALTTVMLRRRWGSGAAIATMLVVSASPYLVLYGSAMLTESLTALWSAILLALAWRHARNPSVGIAVAMGVVTVVSGFTRQSTLIPAGAFVTAWLCALLLRRRPNPWGMPALVVGTTAVGVQLLQMWLFPGFSQVEQFEMVTKADTLSGAIANSPDLAWAILRKDIWRYSHYDHALFVLLALAVVSMVVFWRRSESHLLLGSLLAYELYNVTNGTSTTFRYGMPGLVFVAASVALLVSRALPAATRPAEADDAAEAEALP
jgi:hypothetical protein